MKRKLVKVGNSLAVTIPQELVKEFSLVPGMEVEASVDATNGCFMVKTGMKYLDDGNVSDQFKALVDNLLKERHELYKRLS